MRVSRVEQDQEVPAQPRGRLQPAQARPGQRACDGEQQIHPGPGQRNQHHVEARRKKGPRYRPQAIRRAQSRFTVLLSRQIARLQKHRDWRADLLEHEADDVLAVPVQPGRAVGTNRSARNGQHDQ